MSVAEHRRESPAAVSCVVVTVSDTRTADTDTSGGAIAALLEAHGHRVLCRTLVRDEPAEVVAAVDAATRHNEARVVLVTGGTGIARRDRTAEALAGRFEKRLDGFGELFRMLSYQDIGPAAMLSRACAGTIGRSIVFVLPGSEAAVRLAMERLILPEIGHIVRELSR